MQTKIELDEAELRMLRLITGEERASVLEQVPTLCIDWLSDAQQRAYVIADNRLAEKAGWDRGLLALELGELVDLDFDETLTGFETAEIELLLRGPLFGGLRSDLGSGNARLETG